MAERKHTAIQKLCLIANDSSPIDPCLEEALITAVMKKVNVELNYNGEKWYQINYHQIIKDIMRSGSDGSEEMFA